MASLTDSRQSVFPLNVVINLRNKIYRGCPPKDEETFKYEKRDFYLDVYTILNRI